MQKEDLTERAGVMLDQADKIGCKQFVTPKVRQIYRQTDIQTCRQTGRERETEKLQAVHSSSAE